MAQKKNPADTAVNFEDLLNLNNDDIPATPAAAAETPAEAVSADIPDDTPEAVVEAAQTPEQARIAALEAELSQPLPKFEEEFPAPAAAVAPTPEQLRIKELEDKLAQRNATIVENSAPSYDSTPAEGGKTILLNVIKDGFVAMGQVWFRGQEMEFVIGSPAYNDTFDREGKTWLSMVNDIQAQYDRWGEQMLAPGKFVGRRDEMFDDDVAKQDARRGRKVPVFNGSID